MGEHSREPVCYGAMMARGANDEAVGYQAYRIVRVGGKGAGERELIGPVRETYTEAAADAAAVREGA